MYYWYSQMSKNVDMLFVIYGVQTIPIVKDEANRTIFSMFASFMI